MFKSIREYFTASLERAGAGGQEMSVDSMQLAAAALMIEVLRADHVVDAREREVVIDALTEAFGMERTQAEDLMELADTEVDDAVSLYEFTRQLNAALTLERKAYMIELLWRVAMADAIVEKYEEYLVRKVADLLYVPHRDFIRARHRAEERAKG